MRTKAMLAMILALAALLLVAGCGKDDNPVTPEAPPFAGLWHLAMDSDAGDPGWDLRIRDDGTATWYTPGTDEVRCEGTWYLDGEMMKGDWHSTRSAQDGTLEATLIDDNVLDFLFKENKDYGIKNVDFTGSRLE